MSALRKPADYKAREAAATQLDTTFFVEAAAGTGKTTALVARIISAVTSGRARLHEIVAITFTEKAAGELKARVREELTQRVASASGGLNQAGVHQALEDLERAQITTIHAFCAGLLRERPVEAAVDPQFVVADELQTRVLFDEAWRRWLEGELAQNPPALRHALVREVRLEVLRALAELLVEQRTRLESARWPAAVPVDLPAVRQRLQAAGPALTQSVRHCVAKRDGFCVNAQTLLDALPQLADAAPDRALAILSALDLRQPRAKAEFDSEAAFHEAKTLVKDLQPVLAELAAAAEHNFLVEIVAWLTGFTGFYQEFKRTQAVLDFDDLLIKARDLLRTTVGAEFQQRVKFLLVDEFQDTDPVQTELVQRLAGQTPGSPRSERGKLFIVGDPKQSIYGFRRADIEMYAGTRRELAQAGQVLQFQQNFRSQATIVAWVNAVFRKIFVPADFQPAYIELSPWHPPAGKVAVLRPQQWPAKQSIAATRAAEATAIARYLRQQVAAQACQWGEVAVLFRSLTGLEQFTDVFSAEQVPFRIVGGKGYYQRQEIQTLIALLCCLDNPNDTLNLVAVLRSPLFGWTDEQIFLAHAANQLNYLSAGADALAVLRELHEGRHDLSTAAFLEDVLVRTHFCQAVFAVGPAGGAGVANLLKALELARQLEAAGRRSLRGLVRQLRATVLNGLDEEPAPASHENQDVVQLLTMHKSKGLQFPVVVLADLAGKSQDNQMCLLPARATHEFQLRCAGCRTAGFAAAKADQDQRDEAEEIRLLYVAATRAERQLVIPWFKETGERLDLLARGFQPVASELVEVVDVAALPTGAAENTAHPTPPAGPLLVERQRWQTERGALLAHAGVSAARVSPSSLGHEPEPREEEPAPGARAAAMDFGVSVHDALERMDATGLTGPARDMVERALQSDLLQRVGRAAEVYRELPFTAATLDGKIDLLFREGEHWVLVDYKTDAQPDPERYRAQLHAYATALQQVAGITVAEQWLFFLATDEMVSVG